jgi:hypothetical protein
MNITKQMIRYPFALPLLFTCLSLSSCSEETETTFPSGQKATFSANAVTAETRSASTRVSLTPGADISSSDALSWQTGDLLNFRFFNGASSVASVQPFEVKQVESDGSATIEGIVPDISGTHDIVSIYPYKATFQNGNNPTITLPAAQTQVSAGNFTYLKDHLYLRAMLANGIDIISPTNYDVKGVLNYNLLTSLLRFDIKNSTRQNITIKSLNLKVEDSNTSGTFYTSAILNIPNGTLTEESETNSLTLNAPNVNLADNGSYIGYLSVLPTSSAGDLVLTVDVLDENGIDKTFAYDLTNVPAFESGFRYAASIDLAIDDDEFTSIVYKNFEYTPNSYLKNVEGAYLIDGVYFLPLPLHPDAPCPDGWSQMRHTHSSNALWDNMADMVNMFETIGFEARYARHSTEIVDSGNWYMFNFSTEFPLYYSVYTVRKSDNFSMFNSNQMNTSAIRAAGYDFRCMRERS